jgi:hypothetical protein
MSGPWKTMGLPWIGADDQQIIGVLYVFGRVAGLRAKQLAVDPEAAGLLLGQGGIQERIAHRRPQRRGMGAAQVIPLAATTVIGE